MTVTVPLFVNGAGMRGGTVHHSIEGHPYLGAARPAPRYQFFSVRDEFPALWPVDEGGSSIEGELYDVPLAVIRDRFIPAEPPELELGVLELLDGGSALGRAAARVRARCGRRTDGHLRSRRVAGVPSRSGGLMDFDLVIRAKRVVTPAGEVARCVAVREGVVAAVAPLAARLEGAQTLDLPDDEVLLPGLVDTHVHVNEPGRTAWEGFATATRAAAAGGVTTVLDMPLNSIPPTCTVSALEIKQKAADGQCHVDVAFWGGAIPGNVADLRGLHDAGVFGFKSFMAPSGVEEFPPLSAEELDEYLAVLHTFDAMMIVHAEDGTAIERAPAAHGPGYADFLASRPRGAENVAIARLVEAARHSGARVHLLHLSSADAVPMIRMRRTWLRGVPVDDQPRGRLISRGEA